MKVLKLFSILFCFVSVNAQLVSTAVGSALDLGGECYRITQNTTNQVGGVWYSNPINLDSSFVIRYKEYFGFNDWGADGMALVFKLSPTAVIGSDGGWLGYNVIDTSLAIEFDTFQNLSLFGDPASDHIAVLKNGNLNHNSTALNLAGPVSIGNIEDNAYHNIKVEWDALTDTLKVYFDCNLELTYGGDIKTNVFYGASTVYFGFVGATAGAYNLQVTCFNSLSFVDNLVLHDTTICEGNSIAVDATTSSGVTYSWFPTTGVSNPTIANPILSPLTTTTYTVDILDECGDSLSYDITVTVSSIPPIVNDLVFCVDSPITEIDALGANINWYSSSAADSSSLLYSGSSYTHGFTSAGVHTIYATQTVVGCPESTVDTGTVTINSTPLVDAGRDEIICGGNVYAVFGASAINYSNLNWTSSGTGIFDNSTLLSPVYTPSSTDITTGGVWLYLTAYGNSPCGSYTDSMRLDIIPVAVDASPDTIVCSSDTIVLGGVALADTDYLWFPDTLMENEYTANASFAYINYGADTLAVELTLTATSTISGCSNSDTVIVSVLPLPPVNAQKDTLVCHGETVNIGTVPSSGHTYSWSPTNYLFNPSMPLTDFTGVNTSSNYDTLVYSLTVMRNDGCTNTDSLEIVVRPQPDSVQLSGNFNVCASSTENYMVDNQNLLSTYSWNISGGALVTDYGGNIDCFWSMGTSTTISVQETDGHGCMGPVSTELVNVHYPTILCGGDIYDTIATNICSYVIGDYSSQVTVNENCDLASLQYTQTPPAGNAIDVTDNGTTLQTLTITGTDNSGLSSMCEFDLYIICLVDLFIPQLVTPNGDGSNDTWEIKGIESRPENKVQIFNRWGRKVYEMTNYQNDWKGEVNVTQGNILLKADDGLLPDGVYFYIVDTKEPQKEPYKGYLHIYK